MPQDEPQPSRDEPQRSEPLVSYRAMFEAEVAQARRELERPLAALLTSGITAGLAVGVSVLMLAMFVTMAEGEMNEVWIRLLMANAYALGFVLAILARTDLFTEYTTIAVFPVLTGHSRLRSLVRLWTLVYLGNLIGGLIFALLAVNLGTALPGIDAEAFAAIALHVVDHTGWVLFFSASLTGWLMGLLSWLIAGARETISQIVFIWLVTFSIGIVGLHHVVLGAIELFAGAMTGSEIGAARMLHFLFWVTLGNGAGGVLFAVMVRQGVRLGPEGQPPPHQRRRTKQEREKEHAGRSRR